MTDEMNAVQHLEAAARLVREERASISVVGRPLTPEEERRLQALEAAEADIESAIGQLTVLSDDDEVNLPADGRFAWHPRSQDDSQLLVLRVLVSLCDFQ